METVVVIICDHYSTSLLIKRIHLHADVSPCKPACFELKTWKTRVRLRLEHSALFVSLANTGLIHDEDDDDDALVVFPTTCKLYQMSQQSSDNGLRRISKSGCVGISLRFISDALHRKLVVAMSSRFKLTGVLSEILARKFCRRNVDRIADNDGFMSRSSYRRRPPTAI